MEQVQLSLDNSSALYSDSDRRLLACWRNTECTDCINSRHGCGWCPTTSSCVPITNIFDPVRHPDICPHWRERWELRAKPFGCGCSTLTLLAVLITIASTILGLGILYGLFKLFAWINRVWGFGSLGGSYLEIDGQGDKREGLWFRKGWWKPHWFRRRRIMLEDDTT